MRKLLLILLMIFLPVYSFADGLGQQIIDKTLTVSFTNEDSTDCDSVPTFEVYEDENGTAIASGSMAKLNDAGTIGFYSELLTLSAANGYETGKSYSMLMECAVSATNRQVTHSWDVITAPVVVADLDTTAEVTSAIWDEVGAIRGTADSGSTTTIGDSLLSSSESNAYIGSMVLVDGETAIVRSFNAGTDTITFDPALSSTASGQAYVLIPHSLWEILFRSRMP